MEAKNQFGGFWTQQKIEIFIKYLFAYLEIMKNQKFELIYFDGFAGCGRIDPDDVSSAKVSFIESVAMQVLSIDHTKTFDIYYLVDKHKKRAKQLENLVKENFPTSKAYVVNSDCNQKLIGMSQFMKQNQNYKSLAFIDPFGMNLDWNSLESCRGLGIDMWILIPTGVAVNRLLMNKQSRIPDSWYRRLERFYGMSTPEIKEYFYRERQYYSLFGSDIVTETQKVNDSIQKAVDLYQERLNLLWKFVSKPYPMKNSTGSVIYHFLMATNNASGLGIANDIIGKKLNNR